MNDEERNWEEQGLVVRDTIWSEDMYWDETAWFENPEFEDDGPGQSGLAGGASDSGDVPYEPSWVPSDGPARLVFYPDGDLEVELPPEWVGFRRPRHHLLALTVSDMCTHDDAFAAVLLDRIQEVDIADRECKVNGMWEALHQADVPVEPERERKLIREVKSIQRDKLRLVRERGWELDDDGGPED